MITVVKVGGDILDSKELTTIFLDSFLNIKGPKILVHGGGKSATNLAKKMGVDSQLVNGRRITSPEMMDILKLSFSSKNKEIVSYIQHKGVKALGLSGADFGCIQSKRRNPKPLDYGLVGDPIFHSSVNELIEFCIYKNAVPVFCSLTIDVDNGQLLNTNADEIALNCSYQAKFIDRTIKLLYVFELDGVLSEIDNNSSKMSTISLLEFNNMRTNGRIHSGMIPKLETGFKALDHGISEVEIVSYRTLKDGTKLKLNENID